MESPDLFRNAEGDVPFLDSDHRVALADAEGDRPVDFSGWLGLGGMVHHLAATLADWIHPTAREEPRATLPSGHFVTGEWTNRPDRFDNWFPWRGWIPEDRTDFLSVQHWFMNTVKGTYSTRKNPRGELRIAYTWAERFKTDYHHIAWLVDAVCDSYPGKGIPRAERPPTCNPSILEAAFDSEHDLQAAYMVVKRAVRDRIGFLRWYTAAFPGADRVIEPDTWNQVERYLYRNIPSSGYVVSLTDDWMSINLDLWVRNKIPVYYRWEMDDNDETSHRYQRLNPWLIAVDGKCNGDRVYPGILEVRGDRDQAGELTHQYDRFLQLKGGEEVYQVTDTLPLRAYHYIIDFMGWKRRPIPDGADLNLYARTFKGIQADAAAGSEYPIVVFWRFALKDNPALYTSGNVVRYREPDEFNESVIREQYRVCYAPRHNATYNPIDGSPVDEESAAGPDSPRPIDDNRWNNTVITQREYRSNPDWLLSGSPPISGAAVAEDQPEEEAEPDEDRTRTPTLMERTGVVVSSRENSIFHRRRSASPLRSPVPLLLESGIKAREIMVKSKKPDNSAMQEEEERSLPERPDEAIRKLLREATESSIWPETFNTSPSKYKWKRSLLKKGILILTDVASEVRMRGQALSMEPSSSLDELLTFALEHYWQFAIGIREEDAAELLEGRAISALEASLTETLYNSEHHERELHFTSAAEFIPQYRSVVAEILQRPHAQAFIGLGGPHAWLARKFGGAELVEAFMQGPSIQTLYHHRGRNGKGWKQRASVEWDQVTPAEINLLFGLVKHSDSTQRKWLFPTPAILEDHFKHWSGDWNSTLEHIFSFILEEISALAPSFEPRTEAGWKLWFSTHQHKGMMIYKPMPSTFRELLRKFERAGYYDTWNLRALKDIDVPEYPVDTPRMLVN